MEGVIRRSAIREGISPRLEGDEPSDCARPFLGWRD